MVRSFSTSVSHDGGWELYFLGYIMEGKKIDPVESNFKMNVECKTQVQGPMESRRGSLRQIGGCPRG